MSDAASALALMIVPGAASTGPNAALLAAKATGMAADGASAGGADGFAAYVLAAASAASGNTDASLTLLTESTKTGAKLALVKTDAGKLAADKADDSDSAPSSDMLSALAQQPLPPAVPVQAPTLSDEAKAAFVAAAQASGTDGVAQAASAEAATPAKTTAPGAPALPATGEAVADAVKASGDTASADAAASATGQTAPADGSAAPSTTPVAETPAPVDAATAAKTLAEVTVPDLVPPEPILTNPAGVLGDARKTTETKAASGQAQGAQSTMLTAARDLVTPSATPETAEPLTGSAQKAAEQAIQHTAKPPAPPPPPATDKSTASTTPASHANEPPRAKPDNVVSGPANTPSAPAPAHEPSAASQATPQNTSTGTSTDPQPAAQANSTAANSLPAPAHSDARPLPMTVIRTDMHAGQTGLPVDQIAVTVARQFRQGTNRFEIRLDPPELGRIDVRLDLSHGGRATATLTADRPETLQLLTRDSRMLEQMLSDAGVRTDSGSLNFALRDQSGRQGQQDQNQAPRLPAETAETPDTKTPVILTASLEPGRLDLRV